MAREYPDRPLVGVGIVVIREGKVLLAQRGQPPSQGLWTLPGGLVETGESLRAAAIREAREETGLEVEIGEIVEVFEFLEAGAGGRPRYHFVIIDFLARCAPGAVAQAASDAAALVWVAWEALSGYPLTPGLEPILVKARIQQAASRPPG